MKGFQEYFKNKIEHETQDNINENNIIKFKDWSEMDDWKNDNEKKLNDGELDFSNLDVSNVDGIEGLFCNLNLTDKQWKTVEKLNFKKIKFASFAFENSNFNGDVSHWDFSICDDFDSMFKNCKNFTGKNLVKYNFNPKAKQQSHDEMFMDCKNLKLNYNDLLKLVDNFRTKDSESTNVFKNTSNELKEDDIFKLFKVIVNGDEVDEDKSYEFYKEFFGIK